MGKGGGALSAWMKEFVTLVFVQTIQAFIFAIIISIILFGLGSNQGTATDISADDNNAALGLMSVFALLSVFKVEDMVKKIFGISDTKASHKSALSSLAKTAMAAKLGSRVLNNTGKLLGGIRGITQSRQDRAKAKKRLEEDMKDEGFTRDKDGTLRRVSRRTTNSGGGSSDAGSSTSNNTNTGNSNGGNSNGGNSNVVNSGGGNYNGGNYNSGMSDASYRRVKNSVRAYEDKLSEINKARDQGIKDIASSLSESISAGIGATAGGILSGADGNIDELLQGIMAGAGAGDTVGKGMVEATDRVVKFVQRNHKRERGIGNKELKKAINEYKDALDKAHRSGEAVDVDVDNIDV